MFAAHTVHIAHEEIQILRDEINHIDSRIADEPALIPQKATLLRKLNMVQSPISRLPRDALCQIFEALSPPPISFHTSPNACKYAPTEYYFPLLLGAVSTLWREITHSTPSLWTSFRWTSDTNSDKVYPPGLLLFYLKNSGGLPLHLEFAFPRIALDGVLIDPSVDGVLIQSLPRIKTLRLYQPSAAWDMYIDKLPFVVDLVLDRGRFCNPTSSISGLYLDRCPALRRLFLGRTDSVGFRAVQLGYRTPWALTVLRLSSMPIDTVLKILCRCPNLIEFSFGSPDDPRHDSQSPSNDLIRSWFKEPVIFPRLEVFEWDYPAFSLGWVWLCPFLNQAHMPALRTLSIMKADPRITSSRSPGEVCFFRQHTRTISELRLKGIGGFSQTSYPTLFSYDSAVKSLTLSHFNAKDIDEIVAMLTPDGSAESPVSMPKLNSLSLSGRCSVANRRVTVIYHLEKITFRQLEHITQMLERRLVKGDRFRLEITEHLPDWTYSIQKRLRELVKKGVELEIVEDSHSVDWLDDTALA